MKKNLLLTAFILLTGANAFAKDIKTVIVTTTPQMHCENCEAKIKNNIRFEKGVKAITTNVGEQKVTIQYDADKNNEANLVKAFEKFGYKAEVVTANQKIEAHEGESCPNM